MRYWPNSFRARLTLQWTLVFGVILVVSLAGIYFGMRRNLFHTLEADLRTIAGTEVASATDGPNVHLHPLDEPAIVNQHYLEKFVQILKTDGSLVKQSGNLHTNAPLINGETLQKLSNEQSQMSDVLLNQTPGRAVSLFVEKDSQTFIFIVAVPYTNILETLTTLRLVLVLVGLWAIVATAFVGYRLATRALRPVDLLTQRAQLIGRDHLKARLVEPQTDDELARLAHVLNEMLDRLYQNIESHQRFAADASHELRSPLTALRGKMEVALRRTRSADEYRNTLTSCLGELDHLIRLTEDLLDLTRSDAQRLALDLREVELEPLIVAEMNRWQPIAETHHLAMQANVKAGLTVIADETRLHRVLGNLISNAIHYRHSDGGHVTVSARNGGNDVWIEVQDDGIGIAQEQQQQIFERFWRADHARHVRTGGAGLGLAICREIIHAHGGKITVQSSPDQGSSFRFSLPAGLES